MIDLGTPPLVLQQSVLPRIGSLPSASSTTPEIEAHLLGERHVRNGDMKRLSQSYKEQPVQRHLLARGIEARMCFLAQH